MARLVKNTTLENVAQFLEMIAPKSLAGSWDNVGLLAQAPTPCEGNGVFLAVDLTTEVADELLSLRSMNTAIIYHPVIFSPVRSLKLAVPLQQSVLRCIAAGVSIYCPHTCLDAMDGGINDWLVVGLAYPWEDGAPQEGEIVALLKGGSNSKPVEPCSAPRTPTEGLGRVKQLARTCTLADMVSRTKQFLGLQHVQIALADGKNMSSTLGSFATCAGSGASVLRACTDVDVWITGEASHHEILAANAQGVSLIITNHTNTERRFFRDVFAPLLRDQLPALQVHVSDKDRDPLMTV
ncbi:hypothetical protein MVES1_003196 [Malassezia vespertilionis]|uniref:Nif3p n=1 Tax=Malassezia vespertilionis TaxID=2020962 RepID=A0A2N1J9V5_9BASI|nr:uncharacterized protein MVES1_003196 [Malassezia vespertilionis]PKI83325.1 hypothetical protein MVES_003036 [Malassezia vespertilionis]WFD07825.1 hypothetical protein MVES1_003196 [Malassezia vespertilionis]